VCARVGVRNDLLSHPEAAQSSLLRRQLGLIDVSAIFVGIIIGSGIFTTPSYVAGAAPGILSASILWIIGGAIAACGAFCYAECASRMPHTGGFYVYFREVYGEGAAFVGGWSAILVTYPVSIAFTALVAARYFAEVVPATKGLEVGCAAVAVMIAGLLNAFGIRLGAIAQRALTGSKVAALAILCLAALIAGGAAERSASPVELNSDFGVVLGALVGVLFTYDGWSDVTMIAGEVKDPAKNLGRAVLLGIGLLVGLYVLVQVSVLTLLSPEQAAHSGGVLAEAVRAGVGSVSARTIALLVLISTMGSITGVVLAASRLGFAVLRDQPGLSWLARVHAATGAPIYAISAIVGASIAYVMVASLRDLINLFSFTVWLFYGMTAVALLVLRKRNIGDPEGWRAPLGPIPPVVVLATGVLMAIGQIRENPVRSLIGLSLLLAGVPVFLIKQRMLAKKSA
jgi:APA family basic amino acid/polyamine antiporter